MPGSGRKQNSSPRTSRPSRAAALESAGFKLRVPGSPARSPRSRRRFPRRHAAPRLESLLPPLRFAGGHSAGPRRRLTGTIGRPRSRRAKSPEGPREEARAAGGAASEGIRRAVEAATGRAARRCADRRRSRSERSRRYLRYACGRRSLRNGKRARTSATLAGSTSEKSTCSCPPASARVSPMGQIAAESPA